MRTISFRSRPSAASVLAMVGLLFALIGPEFGPALRTQPAVTGDLTPEQLAGQRVIYSYSGLTPPNSLLQRVKQGRAAGVIFFGENIASKQQISSVIDSLRSANRQSPVSAPLLLLTDQEGGQVNRLPGAPSMSEKQVGQSADPVAAAKKTGAAAAKNLSGVGMNLNLSPVLGVYRQPGDFLDRYGRSYGSSAADVAPLGGAYISAQQRAGVAATAKHFPGLGAAGANENTDRDPVTLDVGLSQLRDVDEKPYENAIDAGVDVVLGSWAVYPALDPDRPAGLSSKVIQDELRGRLGFEGVTMTDALGAGALQAYGSPAHRGVLAAEAGMDLLLCSARDVGEGDGAAGGLTGGLKDGSLDHDRFLASVHRVTALRKSLE